MEELKLLITLVKDLPAMAIWLLVIFYGYKVVIVGSIYGLFRFAISRLHSWATTPRHKLQRVDILGDIRGMTITHDNSHEALIGQLLRLRGRGIPGGSKYIHGCSVEWLAEAIDAKIAAEYAATPAKESPAP